MNVTGLNIEEYDKYYDDPYGDVIVPSEVKMTNEYPEIDILSVETDDNCVDKVIGKIVLAAPPDTSGKAMYGLIIGDLDTDNTVGGLYSQNANGIVYADGQVERWCVKLDENTIIWEFDRDKLPDFDNYDINGITALTLNEGTEEEETIGDFIYTPDKDGSDENDDRGNDNNIEDNDNETDNEVINFGIFVSLWLIVTIMILAVVVILKISKKNTSQESAQYYYPDSYPATYSPISPLEYNMQIQPHDYDYFEAGWQGND
jgi:hypothetical protein